MLLRNQKKPKREARNVNIGSSLNFSTLEARFFPIIEKHCDFIDSDLLLRRLINNKSLFQDRMSLQWPRFPSSSSSCSHAVCPFSSLFGPPLLLPTVPSLRLLYFHGASIDKWGAEAPVSPGGGSRMSIAHSVSARAIFGVFLLALRGSPLTRYESEEADSSWRTTRAF